MKKLTFLFTLLLVSHVAFSVAVKTVETDKLTFHNFSAWSYDVTGHIITVNTTQYMVGNLTVVTGTINTAAGTFLTFSGITAGSSSGSVALWAPGTVFPNPSPANLVDFVQWGAAGQAYASVAIAAGLWSSGTFVNSSLPITRSNNYGSTGSSEWASSMALAEISLEQMVQIGPLPFDDELNFKFEQGHDFTLIRVYDVLGKLLHKQKFILPSESFIYHSSKLKKGVYLVQLETVTGKVLVKRVLKN
jgi:hypothetical protein